MHNPEQKSDAGLAGRSLSEAIRKARIRLAEDIDGVADRRLTELARLELLKAELEGIFEQLPATEDRFALVLATSTPARLWIDVLTYVTRDPAQGLYCFVKNGRDGPKVLAETASLDEIANRVIDYIAEQIVARERQLQGVAELERRLRPPPPSRPRRPRAAVVVGAFLVGILTGVLGLLLAAYLMAM